MSTIKVALGPAAEDRFPILSVAVPLEIDIPKDPFPVMPEIVTVRVVEPEPETDTAPFAVPDLFKVILEELKVTAEASE